ncbi:oxidoreductase [Mycobacterium sp. CPCC 205372]|uniref:Oxidoreductase n=1 Tax=Mycobacterium hippophais TaxID=3016340 RepID=A0ABT4PTP7_9MYCO|nr:oxidoreductase [Mycobacterium hippophais]MCZ8379957.1 oxidoreductase [Mycobacterium hippophais]
MTTQPSQVWMVTGCSTGFGRSLAEHLLDRGQKVVATARDVSSVADLADRGNALILPLDVVNREQCSEVVEAAVRHFGTIDVLVNNAGIGYFGAIEETDDKIARLLFDVNFFGTANAIHAILPVMRTQRSGTIINLTSIGGLSGFAAVGYYSASKFAVEGLSESLRIEVAPLGLNVMVVEPSGFRTNWAASSNEVENPIEDYDQTAGQARRAYHQSVGNQAGDPARAAAAIFSAATSAQPPQRLLLGNEAVDVALAKAATLQSDIAAWEHVSRAADYPDEESTDEQDNQR